MSVLYFSLWKYTPRQYISSYIDIWPWHGKTWLITTVCTPTGMAIFITGISSNDYEYQFSRPYQIYKINNCKKSRVSSNYTPYNTVIHPCSNKNDVELNRFWSSTLDVWHNILWMGWRIYSPKTILVWLKSTIWGCFHELVAIWGCRFRMVYAIAVRPGARIYMWQQAAHLAIDRFPEEVIYSVTKLFNQARYIGHKYKWFSTNCDSIFG